MNSSDQFPGGISPGDEPAFTPTAVAQTAPLIRSDETSPNQGCGCQAKVVPQLGNAYHGCLWIGQALASLSEIDWLILDRKHSGSSFLEIAGMLGLDKETVVKRFAHALDHLNTSSTGQTGEPNASSSYLGHKHRSRG